MGILLDYANKVGNFKIQAKPKDLNLFCYTLKNVLTRMDKYFTENNLYEQINFSSALSRLLPQSFGTQYYFTLGIPAEMTERNAAGTAHKDHIEIRPDYFTFGTTLEGIMCHEFFHFLTTSTGEYNYFDENGVEYSYTNTSVNRIKRTRSPGNNIWKVSNPTYYCSIESCKVIREGLTELCKQQIYGTSESYASYRSETKLLDYLHKLSFTDDFMAQYLRGEMPSYDEFFGEKRLSEFISYLTKCEDNIDYDFNSPKNPNYKKAIYLIAETFIDNFASNKTPMDAKTLIKQSAILLDFYPKSTKIEDKLMMAIYDKIKASHPEYDKKQAQEKTYQFMNKIYDQIGIEKKGVECYIPNSKYSFSISKSGQLLVKIGTIQHFVESPDNENVGYSLSNSTDTLFIYKRGNSIQYEAKLNGSSTYEKIKVTPEPKDPLLFTVSTPDGNVQKINMHKEKEKAQNKLLDQINNQEVFYVPQPTLK